MPVSASISALESIVRGINADPGLRSNISAAQIAEGIAAARKINQVLADVIESTGANADGVITTSELMAMSDAIRASTALYAKFLDGHGDDEGGIATGFHNVQNDGGTLMFQGRKFIDTIADATYHTGFTYSDGRFVNEDGDANEEVADVAGWLNYFLNGVNRVFGSSGDDELYSGDYSAAFAAAANETFHAGAGNDSVWADAGHDRVYAGTGDDQAGGGTGNDMLYGGAGHDSLWGDEGNDYAAGEDGDDNLGGGDGNDTLNGGAGHDSIGGGAGADVLAGGAGNDTLWGDDGDDTLDGGDGDDEMGGGAGNNTLTGGAGNDQMWGDAGDDTLSGGDGDDTIGGGDGSNQVDGGAGNDSLWAGAGTDVLLGGLGDDELGGGDGADLLSGGDGHDTMYGGAGADTLNGEAGDDLISGDEGNDRLYGNDGGDTLWGGDGRDVVSGRAGNDTLKPGEGRDAVRGGQGADTFHLWDSDGARDTIYFAKGDSGTQRGQMDFVEGFVSGQDLIDLREIGPMTFEDINFATTGAASAYYDGRFLRIDTDGNQIGDMMIEFAWINELTAADFLFA